jgi:GAF domain
VLAGVLGYVKTLPGKVADVLIVPLLVAALVAVVLFIAGLLADSSAPLWTVALALAVGLVAGLVLGRVSWPRDRDEGAATAAEIADLRRRVEELDPYATYAEHLRDALGDLRKVVSGEVPAFSVRDFIETGLFYPAHRLLTRSGRRVDVRFSVLHPDGDDFVMSGQHDLFPAFGHRIESRQKFRLPIAGSFSALAYHRNRVFWSGNLSEDDRFERHELADHERSYESIVSVPLRMAGKVDGVLNAIATNRDAFSEVDRTYISLLASIADVSRVVLAAEAQRGEATP